MVGAVSKGRVVLAMRIAYPHRERWYVELSVATDAVATELLGV